MIFELLDTLYVYNIYVSSSKKRKGGRSYESIRKGEIGIA